MSLPRSMIRMGSCFLFALGGPAIVAGCGDSGAGQSGKTVYSSPEEINAKNKDLKDAMQGGAYGSAGKRSAGTIK